MTRRKRSLGQPAKGTAGKRYVAFLRGVSPTTAKMTELAAGFESAGFCRVRTVLASGNVVFSARSVSSAALERRAEAALKARLGKTFLTIVRSVDELSSLLAKDPFAAFSIPRLAKCVVTFLRDKPVGKLSFPIEVDGARLLGVFGREVLTVYEPNPRGPVFMQLIEKTFGQTLTTRTWDTSRKVVASAAG